MVCCSSPPLPLPAYTASCYGLLGSAATPRRLGRSAGGPLTTVGSDCGEVLGWLLLLGGRTLQADGREEKCHWLLPLHLCFFPCCCCWKRHLWERIHSFHFYIALCRVSTFSCRAQGDFSFHLNNRSWNSIAPATVETCFYIHAFYILI